jgi:hypothetical protein
VEESLSRWRHAVVAACAALPALTGCSILFVTEAPAKTGSISGPRPGNCTSSAVAPVVDSVIGGLQVARTVVAATADDSVYSDPNQPLSRPADVGIGIALSALFLASAGYGYYETSHCRALKEHHTGDFSEPDGERPDPDASDANDPEMDDAYTPAKPSPRAADVVPPPRGSAPRPPAPAASAAPVPPAPASPTSAAPATDAAPAVTPPAPPMR